MTVSWPAVKRDMAVISKTAEGLMSHCIMGKQGLEKGAITFFLQWPTNDYGFLTTCWPE